MTYTPEQPQHPAAPYYSAAPYASQAKDLTAFGVLAFSAAVLYTVFTVVTATVTGRAIRHLDDAAVDWSLPVYFLGSVLSMLSLLAGWILGSIWLHRARKNAEFLTPGSPHARSAGWAWGGWICPIVSLWFPFQVVRDVHKAQNPLSTSPLIGWWWALFLVMLIGTNISDRFQGQASVADAGTAQGLAVFSALTAVAALALWGLILRRVTRDQHEQMYAG